ncbi:isoamylase early set domain-containing protein [Ferruginibacter albus]|uniref:isoamylase early set domain-containing protein n=1 Tax=Ferruginibacter albus TaxID=2875540 RepID=UPI001CC5644A|nr:isoamylase early set domain-containing protein [Ferruginibacter albus]UAY53467.1 isoamylase early set domain-containing protein [Ferruginibacter albus]
MATKVTFTLSAETVGAAKTGVLLGDFNNWDPAQGTALKKQKDGSLKAVVSLQPGETYHYRYLLEDGRWENDENADFFVYDYNVQNCVITIPAEEKKAAKPKAAAKPAAVKASKEKATKAPAKKAAPKKAAK